MAPQPCDGTMEPAGYLADPEFDQVKLQLPEDMVVLVREVSELNLTPIAKEIVYIYTDKYAPQN